MMKRIILILAIIFSVKSYSQDPAFTQSFMVPESINPSFSGFYETTKAGLLYKNQQWSGFDFNLNSQYLYFDDWYPDLNSGVGISLMNHQETFTNYSLKQLNLSWAYKVQINYEWDFRPSVTFGFATKDFGFDNLAGDTAFLISLFPSSVAAQWHDHACHFPVLILTLKFGASQTGQ